MVTVRRLIWDPGNVAHIARHDVTPEEVTDLCRGDFLTRDAHHGRIIVFGPTSRGRMLAAILDPEPEQGAYYPVSARPASRQERKRYQEADQEAKRGEQT
jgi:uncharacterized DUF497 family protein